MTPMSRQDDEHPRTTYPTSTAWLRRRQRWLAEQLERTGRLSCVVCWHPVTRYEAELHHLSQSGVTHTDGRWTALEDHDDLCAMHPDCHRRVHAALDAHPLLTLTGVRPVSTVQAIRIARDGLARAGGAR